jgi:hypothetical protein
MKQFLSMLTLSTMLSSQAMAGNLTVHEWGTFTSFMGSDGVQMEGLHHEDETLPNFVYGLKKEAAENPMPTPRPRPAPCRPISKVGCETLYNLMETHSELFPEAPISAGVTQKMETPVIYFYGEAGQNVNVEINFPQGIITQYYPQASYNYPKLSEARELKDSKFIFDVTLLDPKTTLTNYTPETSIWSPARKVQLANVVQSNNGNKEKFIFYRGIGDFASPLQVTSDQNDVLTLVSNNSPISMAFILNSNGIRGNFQTVGDIGLKTGSKAQVPNLNNGYPFDEYVTQVKKAIATELVRNGLFEAEAQSMVNTWEKSYFKTPGMRVLYIVPNNSTEEILPLSVKPIPTELKRVLVGRVEIMTKNQEITYLKSIQNGIIPEEVLSRFSEPKLRRLESIAPEGLKAFIRKHIN